MCPLLFPAIRHTLFALVRPRFTNDVLLDDARVVPQNVRHGNHPNDSPILRHGQMPGGLLLHHAHGVDNRPIPLRAPPASAFSFPTSVLGSSHCPTVAARMNLDESHVMGCRHEERTSFHGCISCPFSQLAP